MRKYYQKKKIRIDDDEICKCFFGCTLSELELMPLGELLYNRLLISGFSQSMIDELKELDKDRFQFSWKRKSIMPNPLFIRE